MKKLLLFATIFLIALVAVNAQPTLPATITVASVNETQTAVIEVTLTAGPDNGSTTWTWDSAEIIQDGSTNNTYGKFIWLTDYNDAGSHTFTLNVSDLDSFDTQTVTINVANVNRLPVITSSAPTTATAGHQYTYNISATDADANPLIYQLTTSPTGMSIVGNIITWTPGVNQVGTNAVALRVTDGTGDATQTFNVEVSSQSYSIAISDVYLGGSSQNREENTSAGSFTVTNTGTEALQGVTLVKLASTDYQLGLSTLNIGNMASGETRTVSVTSYVPDYQDAGEKVVGLINATATNEGLQVNYGQVYLEAENNLEINDLEIYVNGEKDSVNDEDEVKVFPAAEIEIVVEVKNTNRDYKIEDVTIYIEEDGDLDIDESEDFGDIKERKSETATLKFTLDDNVDEDVYQVTFRVEGEDENGALHFEEWTIDFDLTAEGIIMTDVQVNPESPLCSAESFELEVELTNVGDQDEDEVALEIVATSLNFEKRVTFEIQENDDLTRTYTIPIPANAQPGLHVIQLESFIDLDELTHSKNVYVTLPSGCGATTPTDNTQTGNSGGMEYVPPGTNNPPSDPVFIDSGDGQSTSSDFDFGNGWTILLVIINIILLIGIILLVIKFLA
mgnify:CR=1 FL=1|jgi:hypothetical protein